MLFNSYVFLFVFLPLTLVAVHLAGRGGPRAVAGVLVAASLIFYGWHLPGHVLLLTGSVAVNYGISRALHRRGGHRPLLALGVVLNLALLGAFKYLDFLVGTVNAALDSEIALLHIILPLAISFFTFQQIAYLVDVHKGEASPPTLLEYVLFVCFFPQLVAGPIVHHAELVPQFRSPQFGRLSAAGLGFGLTCFAIGLAKKTLLADSFAPVANAAFALAEGGAAPSFFEAWFGTLAFGFQIYFDFSGYSDMAIGLAMMLGLRLPINFAAPYRATTVVEFWRRWHMTLSRFLRDYLYIPLGGNRLGKVRRYVNLMATMLLGGLWHGAAWTFVFWGALHGAYLVANHAWRALGIRLPAAVGWLLTMMAVSVAWAFFRAESFAGAWSMVAGLAGLNGVVLAEAHRPLLGAAGEVLAGLGVSFSGLPLVRLSYFVVFPLTVGFLVLMPTTQALMGYLAAAGHSAWRPSPVRAVAAGLLLAAGTVGIAHTSQFLYFQF